ncbi:MAG TPA: flagellar basal body-associated protein FliL [Polaromonas sp.]|uniref:flagellar basal body-associated protein FliL n=1 Tax=Polaromonas sp. UBA4122 TaxID=1947074 RepID=UPI000ED03D32|nr:flagellar basal body-associated protein FliL [Polaromonas sp. UBA4122]HAL37248.1 flagellar basal body-associated protein FliL [Polaromonas sp.]
MATSTIKLNTPKSRKFIVLLVALVALGITATAAAAYYYLGNNHKGTAAATAPVPADPIFVALEPLTINLQSSGRSRFLQVGVTLKVADAKSQSQVTQYLPEVRSRVLTLLSNRDPDSLLTPNDKTQLAAAIMAVLNQPFAPNLPSAKISSVMFTTFILQ